MGHSPYVQNVNEMNFFNVFVTSQVDAAMRPQPDVDDAAEKEKKLLSEMIQESSEIKNTSPSKQFNQTFAN